MIFLFILLFHNRAIITLNKGAKFSYVSIISILEFYFEFHNISKIATYF